jgi:hypothetical protein
MTSLQASKFACSAWACSCTAVLQLTPGCLCSTRYPYLVKIQQQLSPTSVSTCSGALIDASTVLTAAHCVANATNGTWVSAQYTITVSAGTPNSQEYPASWSIRHPQYDDNPNWMYVNNDVALIYLDACVDLKEYARCVCRQPTPHGLFDQKGYMHAAPVLQVGDCFVEQLDGGVLAVAMFFFCTTHKVQPGKQLWHCYDTLLFSRLLIPFPAGCRATAHRRTHAPSPAMYGAMAGAAQPAVRAATSVSGAPGPTALAAAVPRPSRSPQMWKRSTSASVSDAS